MTRNIAQSDTEVLMVGPSLDAPGGMSAVCNTYARGGLFADGRVRYVSSYDGHQPLTQIAVMSRVLSVLIPLLWRRQLKLLHVHSASRGSFWRKSLLCGLAQLAGVPYLFHLHSGEFPTWYRSRSKLSQRWVRHTFRNAAAVICLTPSWQPAVRDICAETRVRVLVNPIDVPDSLKAMRHQARTIVFLGRLRQKKGVFDLLHAFASVRASIPESRLVLAGDEDEAGARRHAEELGIADAVEFPGWVEGPRKQALIDSADLYVLPSYFEGLPIGLLEAMAFGVPVVATHVGGIPDLVNDGVCGVLTNPGDVTGLAKALTRLMSTAAERDALRTKAFQKVRTTYDSPLVLEKLHQIYQHEALSLGK